MNESGNRVSNQNAIYTINAQCIINVEPSYKGSQGLKLHKAVGDCPNQIPSDQMVLGTVRLEAGPRERWPKALKTKLAQGGPSGSSPLRSDGSRDSQAGGWTAFMVVKDTQQESWKTTLRSQGT